MIVKLSQGHYEHRITYDRQTGRKISDTWGCYGVGICKAVSYGINGNCLTINDSSIPFDSLSNADIKTLNYFELIRIDDNTVALGIDYRKYPDEANVFFYGEEIDLGMDILIDDSEVIEQLGITTSSINLSKGIHQVYENGDYQYVIFN